MKQTAVEWYGLQIGILISKFFNNEISKAEVHFKRIEIEEQAKDMEMIQITEAFDDGFENHCDADLYYNKKFKPDYKNK